ncbi:MAG: hypothetical protein EBU33_00470 [Sphingobacteriia bacterium]|nr:hypothetical protein [Sphingobacteriia bacterium]
MSFIGVEEVIRVHIDTSDRIDPETDTANCTISISPIEGANWVRVASVSVPLSSGTFQVPRDPTGRLKIRKTSPGVDVSLNIPFLSEEMWASGTSQMITENSIVLLTTAKLNANGFTGLLVELSAEYGNVSKWTNTSVFDYTFLEDNIILGVRHNDVVKSGMIYYGRATMSVDGKNDVQYLALPSLLRNNRVSRMAGRDSTQNIACRIPNNSGRLFGAYATFQNQLSDDWSRLTNNVVTEIDIQIFNRNRIIQTLNELPVYLTLEFK